MEKRTCRICGRELYVVHILPDGRCKRCGHWTTDPSGKYSPEEMWDQLAQQGETYGPGGPSVQQAAEPKQDVQTTRPQRQPQEPAQEQPQELVPRKKTLRVQGPSGELALELSAWEKDSHRRIYVNYPYNDYTYGYFSFSPNGEFLQEVQGAGRRSWKTFLPVVREEAIQMARAIWGKEV